MSGTTKKRSAIVKRGIIAAALAAAVFALIYYSGIIMPSWAVWHDLTVEGSGEGEPDSIVLKNRRIKAYKDGICIFESPISSRVQNAVYIDVDRDGERELVLLNFNIGRFGKHRPFWIRLDPPVWRQHIYIYDYRAEERIFRPIWMASDIGMEAADFENADNGVLRLTDSKGNETNWMWISFGLRCVD